MTRKDYVRIAQALADARRRIAGGEEPAWNVVVEEIGDALLRDNSRFKRERFERACGVDDGK